MSLEPLRQFLSSLKDTGLDCDSIKMAEALWLARFIPSEDRATAQAQPEAGNEPAGSSQSGHGDGPAVHDSQPDAQPTPSQQTSDSERGSESDDSTAFLYAPSGSPAQRAPHAATQIHVIAGSALPGSLALGRALRPLIRYRSSRFLERLDEEATAERSAESRTSSARDNRLVVPVFRPEREQLFDLALVIDDSPAMGVWRKTIEAFRRLLERHSAFRDVHLWHLRFGPPSLLTHSGRQVRPETLIDPSGRRLVVIVTQTTHRQWLGHEINHWLWTWAAHGPLAIAHTLPELLWGNTVLGEPAARAQATRMAAPNTTLRVECPWWYERDEPKPLAVPVFSLEPASLKQWARMLMGVHAAQAPAFLFDRPDQVPGAAPEEGGTAPSVTQQIELFQKHSSSEAFELLCSLAFLDFNLPVMRLAQQAVLGSRARQTQLAEVLLSGLLEYASPTWTPAPTDPEAIIYRVKPGVRPELERGVALRSAASVLQALARHIEERLGAPMELAAFVSDAAGSRGLPEWARPFAAAGAALARQLGLTRPPEPLPSAPPGALPTPEQPASLPPEAVPTPDAQPILVLSRTFPDAPGNLRRIAWSPDGTQIASAGFDRKVRVRDAKTGKVLHTLDEHSDIVYGVSWSPDGRRLASASRAGSVTIWNVARNRYDQLLNVSAQAVFGVAWSPDGRMLATTSGDGVVRLWEVSTMLIKHASSFSPHEAIHSIAWSPEGDAAVSASNNGSIAVFTKRGASTYTDNIIDERPCEMYGVAWSSRGVIAAAGQDGVVLLYDRAGVPQGTLIGHSAHVTDLSFSPSGDLLASISWDDTVRVWDMQRRSLYLTLTVNSARRFHSGIAFHPKAQSALAIVAQSASAIEIWESAEESSQAAVWDTVDRNALRKLLQEMGLSPERAARVPAQTARVMAEEVSRVAVDNATALENHLKIAHLLSGAHWIQIFLRKYKDFFVVAERIDVADHDYPNRKERLLQRAIRSREVVWVPDVKLDPDYTPTARNTAAELVIPLVTSERHTLAGLVHMRFSDSVQLSEARRQWLIDFWTPLAGILLRPRSHSVFIGHAVSMEQQALDLASRLRRTGLSVWLSSQIARCCTEQFHDERIALANSAFLVALLPAPDDKSDLVQMDIDFAMRRETRTRVVPVVIEETRIPREIRTLERFDLRSNYAAGMEGLTQLLQRLSDVAARGTGDWLTAAARERRMWHPDVDAWNRGDLSPCFFSIAADFEIGGGRRWSDWADLLVRLDDAPNSDRVYLLPSRKAPASARDPQILLSDEAARENKRTATRAFVEEKAGQRLQGVWFFKTMSQGERRVHVYSADYDDFLQRHLPRVSGRAGTSNLPRPGSAREELHLVNVAHPRSSVYYYDKQLTRGEYVGTRGPHLLALGDAFRIGQYPVTNALFNQFVQAGGYDNERLWSGRSISAFLTQDGRTCGPATWSSAQQWPSERKNHPVSGISFVEARAFIRWLQLERPMPGNTWCLPSEDMWEFSARSLDGRVYPWGNVFLEKHCNSAESGLGTTSDIRAFRQGRSPSGCIDMAGNVWEFVEASDTQERTCVLRGGSYRNSREEVRSDLRLFGVPDDHRPPDFGFRCALVPRQSPSTPSKRSRKNVKVKK